jgi:hypothetical protein
MEFGFIRPEHENFPPIVHVETTNICNYRCIHCPHSDVKKAIPGYQAKQIGMDLWKRVVDEVSQFPAVLRLTPDGEPMLLNDWDEQVRYAKKRGVHTFAFNTHGMFLEGSKAEVLLEPSDTRVSVEISLDGFFRNTYESIRVKGDYRRVVKNILDFLLERDRRKLSNVKVMVSIVQQPEVSAEELHTFDTFWSQMVDKVIIRNYVDTKGLTPKKNIDEREVEQRWPCPVVFTRLVVTWDGRVRFCPDDWLKTTTLTTLDEAGSLQAVWQSEAFRRLRESHLNGTFNHPTCSTCTDWKVIRWGADYVAALSSLFSDPENAPRTSPPSVERYAWNQERDGKPSLQIVR